jgi:hypothetical protein
MVNDNVRVCDVCGATIPKATKYVVYKGGPEKAQVLKSLAEASPDMAPTFTVEAGGSIRLEICLKCKLRMAAPGETVH